MLKCWYVLLIQRDSLVKNGLARDVWRFVRQMCLRRSRPEIQTPDYEKETVYALVARNATPHRRLGKTDPFSRAARSTTSISHSDGTVASRSTRDHESRPGSPGACSRVDTS